MARAPSGRASARRGSASPNIIYRKCRPGEGASDPRFEIRPVIGRFDNTPRTNPRFELVNPRFFGDLGKSKKTYLNPLFKTGLLADVGSDLYKSRFRYD